MNDLPEEPVTDTTRLLRSWSTGDDGAFDELFPRVYEELKSVARQRLSGLGGTATISPTVLVHDAYLRLVDGERARVSDRAHFMAIASRAMRFILVDRARAQAARKRGGGAKPLRLDDIQIGSGAQAAEELLVLNEALERLAGYDERLSRVVEYRFFGGMEYAEIAETTGLSVPTVKRDWARARAWLYDFMTE